MGLLGYFSFEGWIYYSTVQNRWLGICFILYYSQNLENDQLLQIINI